MTQPCLARLIPCFASGRRSDWLLGTDRICLRPHFAEEESAVPPCRDRPLVSAQKPCIFAPDFRIRKDLVPPKSQACRHPRKCQHLFHIWLPPHRAKILPQSTSVHFGDKSQVFQKFSKTRCHLFQSNPPRRPCSRPGSRF